MTYFATPSKPCPCGSGQTRHDLYDARGIFCTFICDACEDEKRARYRPDVLTDPNYEASEPIDGD
jgi:hypothetical protein